jgi:phosphatidylethanolamine-binding protein (PEBP) family uncharacterized protein
MTTDAFEDGGISPERHAGRGGNVRPGLTFSNIPAETVSFAIVFHDLDVAANGAEGVLHWLDALSAMLDVPADATRAQLLDAMQEIIVGKAAYVGRFRQ